MDLECEVMHLSVRQLSPEKRSVFRKKINFLVTPNYIPTDTIANVESEIRQLDVESAEEVRRETIIFPQSQNLLKVNFSGKEKYHSHMYQKTRESFIEYPKLYLCALCIAKNS